MSTSEQKSQKPQTKTQNLLELASEEELAKIEAYKAKTKGAYPVDDYWLLVAEFTRIYGWQSYLDFKDDKIETVEMMTLIEANRKLDYLSLYKDSLTSFIGSASAQAKRPYSIFKRLTNLFIKKSEADE